MVKKEKTPATRIKELIVSSKRILLSLHRLPDGDSIASALAMYYWLSGLGEEVTLISPSPIPGNFDFLPHFEKIKSGNFFNFNPSDFDLFISLDTQSWHLLSGNEEVPANPKGNWQIVNIDHHKTNTNYGDVNLVDEAADSTCGLLLDLFENWQVEIDRDLALCLLTGIVTDTGGFHYRNTTTTTFERASFLLGKGADLRKVMFNFERRRTLEEYRYWQLALAKLQIDQSGRYTKILLSYEEVKKLNSKHSYRDQVASLFLQNLEGTDFGYILVEEEKGLIRGSLRARTDFDVSRIATALGGGGHPAAAGFSLKGISLEEAQKKVEEVIHKILS